jgi:hypothetical protein
LTICRLRRAFDKADKAALGQSLIETGIGSEYRLALNVDSLDVESSFEELRVPECLSARDKESIMADLAHC